MLASCLGYHAQFVPVPERVMQLIQRRITAFVLGLGCIRNSDSRPLRSEPAAAVASLPQQLGGIGQVDVAAHITAMQAKVAAALLHPHRRAWKQFFFFFQGGQVTLSGVKQHIATPQRSCKRMAQPGRYHPVGSGSALPHHMTVWTALCSAA